MVDKFSIWNMLHTVAENSCCNSCCIPVYIAYPWRVPLVVGMVCQGRKGVKRFERSNGSDTALYKTYLYLFNQQLDAL